MEGGGYPFQNDSRILYLNNYMYMYALKIVLELTVGQPDRAEGLSELYWSKFASIVPLL